jgi:hypothetical protein
MTLKSTRIETGKEQPRKKETALQEKDLGEFPITGRTSIKSVSFPSKKQKVKMKTNGITSMPVNILYHKGEEFSNKHREQCEDSKFCKEWTEQR